MVGAMSLVKVRVNHDGLEIRGKGQFAGGVIVEIDEAQARDFARFGQVTILSDEQSAPPPGPRGLKDDGKTYGAPGVLDGNDAATGAAAIPINADDADEADEGTDPEQPTKDTKRRDKKRNSA